MFCSDGVCGLIDDDMIEVGLQLPDLNDALQRLVVESLHEGGIDNITVIVADVVESGGNDDLLVLGAASEQPIRPPGAPRRQLQEDDDGHRRDPRHTVGRLRDHSRRRGAIQPAGAASRTITSGR